MPHLWPEQEPLWQDIRAHLTFLYGAEEAGETLPRLAALMARFGRASAPAEPASAFADQRDVVLITYGDMVQEAGQAPLATLADFLEQAVRTAVNTVHILPFFPYSSDDGFSIIDYKAVDPHLGDWADIAALGESFKLMFDAVVNHVSVESAWFQGYLQDEPPYDRYFITVPAKAGLSAVFRPRALPLITPFETASGTKGVWTTFSADQVDLNFQTPDVLLEIVDTLLFYVQQGAALIRLDAVAFLWKEIGTTCLHLPQTHRIIQLFRSVLDIVAPQVLLITETNVPHEENTSYYGDGRNEAQMVYNFSLPPLTLDAFHRGQAGTLTAWARTLEPPSAATGFFNFLASHDGIGLTPARGLLPEDAVWAMAERVEALGGFVSYRSNPDGSESPYEMNISYLDALGDPARSESPLHKARRFLAAQAIMLALRGVPGIYFHSLFGSQNWRAGVTQTGQKRTINRQKLRRADLERDLADPHSLRTAVFYPYVEMLRARRAELAFHPQGAQEVLSVHEAVFALWRHAPDGDRHVLCLHNVSGEALDLTIPLGPGRGQTFQDLLGGEVLAADGRNLSLRLPPFGVRWLLAQR